MSYDGNEFHGNVSTDGESSYSNHRTSDRKDLDEDKFGPGSDIVHIKLTWRSWLVVGISCWAQLAQVYVVAGAGQNIAFIVRDIYSPDLAGWIIQAPLLMQAVLSPVIGRLSDVMDRKWLVTIPPLLAFAGAIVSATAHDMTTLIGGGILIGTTLATLSIVQAIPSEVLPLKYRAIANGAGFVGSGLGGIIGTLGAGKLTSLDTSGWRNLFWLQAALHGSTFLAFLLLYHPKKNSNDALLSWKERLWQIDPLGSLLFIIGTTLCLLGLDWVSKFGWSSAQVISPLSCGLVALVLFFLYEWLGRDNGIMPHSLFAISRNFPLAMFALGVDGWIFYSAVNTVVPQLTLNLGFENNAWAISVRQLSSSATTLVACVPITWYATKCKDLKSPLLFTFTVFLAANICYALISPGLNAAQIGYNVLVAVGQAGPLTLLVAVIQLATPHDHLATASGLAYSARAVGGAFGSAVLNGIINEKLDSNYVPDVSSAAVVAGLPESSIGELLDAFQTGNMTALTEVPGLNATILAAATDASHWVYAHAYRLAWASIIPFTVLAIIAVAFMTSVKPLMTEKIEASVEPHDKAATEKV